MRGSRDFGCRKAKKTAAGPKTDGGSIKRQYLPPDAKPTYDGESFCGERSNALLPCGEQASYA